jgi:hypothetical protein
LDRELLGLIQRREADALREQLLANGVQLNDTPEGVRWRRIPARPTMCPRQIVCDNRMKVKT